MLIIDLFVITTGLLLGSFFNVVAIRLLNNESFVYPPSHCPQCKHPLAPLDLVPIISFIFLKGTCRYCQKNISLLYPLGELMTSISFYLVYLRFGISLELIPAIMLVTVLVLAVMTDIREKLILDKVTFPSILALALMRIFIGEHSFIFYLIGACTGFLLLLLIAVISKGGMGGGDIKLFAAIGFALGPWLTLMSLLFASLLGAIVGLALIVTGKMRRKQTIAFGPFIALGTLISYLYGGSIWGWYTQMW